MGETMTIKTFVKELKKYSHRKWVIRRFRAAKGDQWHIRFGNRCPIEIVGNVSWGMVWHTKLSLSVEDTLRIIRASDGVPRYHSLRKQILRALKVKEVKG